MRFYSFKNLIIAFLILLGIILIILFNTFYNFRSQRRALSKIQNSREVLQTLEPALVNMQEFQSDLNDLIVFNKDKNMMPYNEARKELQNDSAHISKLIDIDTYNSDKYTRLTELIYEITAFSDTIIRSYEIRNFDTVNNKRKNNYTQGIAAEFKIIVDKLESNSRKVLTDSYSLSAGLARKTFVFTSIISVLLVLALVITFLTSYRDIRVRKKTETQLKKFNEDLEKQVQEKTAGYFGLVDTIDGIVWEADAQTFQFSFASKQAERLLGYPVEQWIKEPTFWADHIHPEDKTWAVEFCIQNTSAKRPHEFEYRMITKDGRSIWLRDIVTVITENDNAVKLRGVMIDITERKRKEREIQKSEEKYRTIIEQASDGIFVAGQNSFIIDANNSGCTMLGYSKEELQKIKFTELIVPENLKNNPIQYDALNGGKSVLSERKLLRKDGTEISVEINAKLLDDGRYQSIIRDITDRKKIEAKLVEQEVLLRLFIEHSPVSLAMFDDNMLYIVTSRRWMKDYNLGEQSIIGKSHYEIFPNIPQRWMDIHQRCLAGAIEKNEEDQFIRTDGSIDWVRWEIHPWYKASGEVGGIIMFTEVITERKKVEDAIKESEERYKVLVENAPEALVVFDAELGKFVNVSESALKLFKMQRDQLLQIGPLSVSPEYQPNGKLSSEVAKEKITDAVDGNKPIFEWMHCDASGKLIPCEVWLVRLPSENSLLIRGSIIDITERKKAQNELEQSYKSIRQLTEHLQNIREEERVNIAREIHDELGQQLTVLKMDISWLKKKLNKSDVEVTKKIIDLLKMTDITIKSVRKISSELRPSLLDDLGLIATMEWHLMEFENRSGIKTSFIASDAEKELPGTIKTTLFRIFQESLTNVARHAAATVVTVSIKLQNNSYVLIISDNGKGFDKEKISGKRTLGILGMKERTAMTGGTYEINSTLGKGTTIEVTIPLSHSNS